MDKSNPTGRDKRRPSPIVRRLPLEDAHELLYWGTWKEDVPHGFDTSVVVVCTSRQKCVEYGCVQTHDYFLFEEDEAESAGHDTNSPTSEVGKHAKPSPAVRDADVASRQAAGGRGFRRLSFHRLVEEIRTEVERAPNITLVVNPGRSSEGHFTADLICRADDLLNDLETRQSRGI